MIGPACHRPWVSCGYGSTIENLEIEVVRSDQIPKSGLSAQKAPGQLPKGRPDVVVAGAAGQAQHLVGIPRRPQGGLPAAQAAAAATGAHEEQRRQQRQGQTAQTAKGSHGSQTFGIWES